MSRPQSNGLVELHDAKLDSKAFMCFDLIDFLHNDETAKVWEIWNEKFTQAKAGNCPYRERCKRYARTIAKRDKKTYQLELF